MVADIESLVNTPLCVINKNLYSPTTHSFSNSASTCCSLFFCFTDFEKLKFIPPPDLSLDNEKEIVLRGEVSFLVKIFNFRILKLGNSTKMMPSPAPEAILTGLLSVTVSHLGICELTYRIELPELYLEPLQLQ